MTSKPQKVVPQATKAPGLIQKIYWLTKPDVSRVDEVRRRLMHKEVVASYSQLISAAILVLSALDDDSILRLLEILGMDRGQFSEEERKQIDTFFSKTFAGQKIVTATGGLKELHKMADKLLKKRPA